MNYELKNLFNNMYWGERDLITKFGNKFKYIKKGKSWQCCYHYAFDKKYSKETNPIIYDTVKYYFPVIFKDIKKGDVVFYTDKKYDTKHTAKVFKKGNCVGETIVRAKFGGMAIFEHKLKDSHKTYGSLISFWRKRK